MLSVKHNEAQAALQISQAGLFGIVESAMDAIITVDEQQRILLFNHAAEKMFRCTADRALGQQLEIFIPERFRVTHPSRIRTSGKTETANLSMPGFRAFYGLRADGEEFLLEAAVSQFEAGGGQQLFTLIMRDITERGRAERRFHQLIENAPNGIVMFDAEGTIALVNAQTEKLFGYDRDELIGQSIELLMPERFHNWQPVFQNAFTRGPDSGPVSVGRELCGLRKDGGEFPVEIGVSSIETEQGMMVVASVVDITERKRAEDDLRKSTENFQALIEATTQAVWWMSEQGHGEGADKWWEDLTGVNLSDLREWEWLKFLHPDDREKAKSAWMDALKNKTLFDIEYRVKNKKGEYQYFAVRGVPIFNTDGSFRQWIGTFTDISQRKQTEHDLRQWAAAFKYCAHGIAIGNPKTNQILACNPAFAEMCGKQVEEITGAPSLSVYDPAIHEYIEKYLAIADSQGYVQYEAIMQRGDGNFFHSQMDVVTVRGDNGELLYRVSAMQDITKRKQAEAALLESTERLNTVIENLSEGLILSDFEGNLLLWNPAALELHGFSSEEDQRRPLANFTEMFELATLDGRVLDFDEWVMARIIRGETLDNVELIIRRKDVAWQRIFSYSGARVKDASGKDVAFLTMVDVTERKHYEQEIIRLNETLEQKVVERTRDLNAVNKELESFSYSVSHDLRAPLRAMDGFSLALLEDYSEKLDATGQNYLNRVRKASQQMARLIDDMLLLSRVTRSDVIKKDVNLSEVVKAVADMLKEHQPRDNKVVFEIEENIHAEGDERLLKIALENLIGNAYKFTSKQENAKIIFGQERKDGQIEYFVKDNGAGFDMAYADKLFGAFQRLHSTGDFEGTGIGLATVMRVIRRHGGQIRAEGKVGEGACFYFTL